MSDDKSVFEGEAWTLFYLMGLGHTASPIETSTGPTVFVGNCPAPVPNGMIEVSRLTALEHLGFVQETFAVQGTVYVITEKGKTLFNEMYNSLHQEAQKTFLSKVGY